MNLQFDEDLQETQEQHEIHCRILEMSCDIAEKLTSLECALHGVVEYIDHGDNSQSYTDEAQDIFNIYQEEQQTELYALLNSQLKIIQ
jgi:hypothetical protein